ncbi:phosphotransferase [Alteromonas sp. C1M14]|uniref:phosphotransferase n=1 Tax=Alteromonas sp. C1M14 TaxID=2841567 RepID=UPI001C096677|nr:phosphotransferase [Alteromonas sp. C1M14]MBU2978041.1 phosphotransferase [Alteromonas sp. C1M14]
MTPTLILDALRKPLALSASAKCVRIGGGKVNHVFRLTDGQRQFAVKDLGEDDFTGIDRAEQLRLQRRLAEQGIAPAPCWLNDGQTLWVEKWVEGIGSDSPALPELPALAQALATVHKQNVDAKPLCLANRWRHYIAKAQLSCRHPLVKEAEALMVKHKLNDKNNPQWVLCHNDLSYGHLVDPIQPMIVDWEYAARGNRFFDVVACAQINGLNGSQSQQLCALYADKANLQYENVVNGFHEQEPVVTLTAELWYLASQ